MSDDDGRDDEDFKDTDKPGPPEDNFENRPTAEILDFASLSERLRTKYEEEKKKAGDKADEDSAEDAGLIGQPAQMHRDEQPHDDRADRARKAAA